MGSEINFEEIKPSVKSHTITGIMTTVIGNIIKCLKCATSVRSPAENQRAPVYRPP